MFVLHPEFSSSPFASFVFHCPLCLPPLLLHQPPSFCPVSSFSDILQGKHVLASQRDSVATFQPCLPVDNCSYPNPFCLIQLLCIDVQKRISCLAELQDLDYMSDVNWDAVLSKQLPPGFIPNVSIRNKLTECCLSMLHDRDARLWAEEDVFLTSSSYIVLRCSYSPSLNKNTARYNQMTETKNEQLPQINLYCSRTFRIKIPSVPEAPPPSHFSPKATKMQETQDVEIYHSSSDLF